MSKQIEAMKLALEALKTCDVVDYQQDFDSKKVNKAITALREALAEQPAQQETKELFGYEIWNLFYRTKEELFEALVDKGIDWATPSGTYNGYNKEWIEANIREVYVHGRVEK